MADKIFAEGASFFAPHEKAPDFVIGSLSVHPVKFPQFLEANKDFAGSSGYIKFDVKKSQKGTFYLELNTFKKGDASAQQTANAISYPSDEVNPDDIPF